jgi:hypothetical protein
MSTLDKRKGKQQAAPGKIEAFVNNYAASILAGKPNVTQAAKDAGYAPSTAASYGWTLLQREDVKTYLSNVVMERCRQLEVDGQRVLKEIAGIAFSPIMPGIISANDKNAALKNLGTYHKLWEGSRGDKIIVINVLPQDEKTL